MHLPFLVLLVLFLLYAPDVFHLSVVLVVFVFLLLLLLLAVAVAVPVPSCRASAVVVFSGFPLTRCDILHFFFVIAGTISDAACCCCVSSNSLNSFCAASN